MPAADSYMSRVVTVALVHLYWMGSRSASIPRFCASSNRWWWRVLVYQSLHNATSYARMTPKTISFLYLMAN